MNYETFISSPEFQKLHPVKQQIISEVLRNHTNASPEAILPKVLSLDKELAKRNLRFTKDETSMLINAMKMNMTPAEQQKIDMLMNMFMR